MEILSNRMKAVESSTAPENKNVIWVKKDNNTGEISDMLKFKGGEWQTTLNKSDTPAPEPSPEKINIVFKLNPEVDRISVTNSGWYSLSIDERPTQEYVTDFRELSAEELNNKYNVYIIDVSSSEEYSEEDKAIFTSKERVEWTNNSFVETTLLVNKLGVFACTRTANINKKVLTGKNGLVVYDTTAPNPLKFRFNNIIHPNNASNYASGIEEYIVTRKNQNMVAIKTENGYLEAPESVTRNADTSTVYTYPSGGKLTINHRTERVTYSSN